LRPCPQAPVAPEKSEQHHRSIRDDFFDIFADRSKVCPLSVALQQSLSLGDWVETLPRTANDNKNQSNQTNVRDIRIEVII
jgi:hypothetical protein